jgi:RNA polymerase sigma-70 factor (ECF subfamily)
VQTTLESPPVDDSRLLQGLRARDGDALEKLYDQYSQILFAVIVRILRDERESEDVLQEVFLQAWKQADRYSEKRGSVKAWLIMMARSRAVDRVRSIESGKRVQAAVAEEEPLLGSEEPRPGQSADREERRRLVRASLEGLSREQREVLELAFYQDMSHSEISEHLKRPLGTVKTQMRSALLALRQGFRKLRDEL